MDLPTRIQIARRAFDKDRTEALEREVDRLEAEYAAQLAAAHEESPRRRKVEAA